MCIRDRFGGREGSTGAARQSTQQAVSAATGVQELETRLTEMLESVQGAGKEMCIRDRCVHAREKPSARCAVPSVSPPVPCW